MRSHGTGLPPWEFRSLGEGVVFEHGVLVFHAETITIGGGCYVGHYAIVKGYHNSRLSIAEGCWIGQHAFLHSAGGLTVEANVGIGPGVRILTSAHDINRERGRPIMQRPLDFAPVRLGEGSDIGTGAIVLPGVEIGARSQIAAGAVVTRSIPEGVVAGGVPAKVLRTIEPDDA